MSGALLRWVGGKRWLLPSLGLTLSSAQSGTYFEPFVGGGAAYFSARPEVAVLADLNPDLINFYRQLRGQTEQFIRVFRELPQFVDRSCYEELRERFNLEADPIARAALFLMLNLTCFNGIWRVNRHGHFNVPYGDRPSLARVADSRLRNAANALEPARLQCDDFEATLDEMRPGDFAFLDPPYEAVGVTECFSRYTLGGFGVDDHKRVADAVRRVAERGCRFVLTVAETELATELYANFSQLRVASRRVARARGEHLRTTDLVVANFALPIGSDWAGQKDAASHRAAT